MAAGFWTCVLIVWRIFDKQGGTVHGQIGTTYGIEWGIFVALAVAALLAYSGSRIRATHQAEPPLPGEHDQPRPRNGRAGDRATATPATRAGRRASAMPARPAGRSATARPAAAARRPDRQPPPVAAQRRRASHTQRTRPRFPHRQRGRAAMSQPSTRIGSAASRRRTVARRHRRRRDRHPSPPPRSTRSADRADRAPSGQRRAPDQVPSAAEIRAVTARTLYFGHAPASGSRFR